jgi:hypothetical protein
MKEEFVHKVTLSSKKVVLLRTPRISHMELATKAVGNRAKDNSLLQGVLVTKELLKILIAQVDGKDVSHNELTDLDSLFTISEYRQIQEVVQKLSGDDEGDGGPNVETISSGAT